MLRNATIRLSLGLSHPGAKMTLIDTEAEDKTPMTDQDMSEAQDLVYKLLSVAERVLEDKGWHGATKDQVIAIAAMLQTQLPLIALKR